MMFRILRSARPYSTASRFKITSNNSLNSLITDLQGLLKDVKTKEDVDIRTTLNLLRCYQSQENQWSQYYTRDSSRDYTRNLVSEISEKSSLLLLVWEPGKSSKIHNHPGANCFMKILKGSLEERLYKKTEEKLAVKRYTTLPVDSVAYIDDSIGLHQMHNATKEVAVSLHLYSPAYDECTIYEKNGESHTISNLLKSKEI